MLQEVDSYVPEGFDTLGYGQNICTQMRSGDTPRQLHEGLQRLGLSREGATQFESMSLITYCRDQLNKLPVGPNDWWG